jgi:hypothetical protein
MRYELQLEMLEQNGVGSDEHAIELLRSEFALTQNAGYFDAVTTREIEVGAIIRSCPQEGVTRYDVELLVSEREDDLDDRRAVARLCRAFTNALNASYFLRICHDALTMRLVARAPIGATAPLASAA